MVKKRQNIAFILLGTIAGSKIGAKEACGTIADDWGSTFEGIYIEQQMSEGILVDYAKCIYVVPSAYLSSGL